MPSDISANQALSSYSLFNATDIKQFLINQLSTGDNPTIKDASYLGSNVNALIDCLAVILQQILFNYSVNASETSFNTAVLYENMNKIVSILNYKTCGKQTSMLPVRLAIELPADVDFVEKKQYTIPRFLTVSHNSSYILKNEIVTPISPNVREIWLDSIMFQGQLKESPIFTAYGDEFEIFTLTDTYINNTKKFISDNFFVVYVDELNNGQWEEYEEVSSVYECGANDRAFERRFTESFDYEFKFGNGINGRKLPSGARVAIFYILSDGEESQLGSDIISFKSPTIYTSALYTEIFNSIHENNGQDISDLGYITVSNTGPSTDISYPESVSSIRRNAPKVFSSQNRLFSKADYKTFIERNYSAYIKDSYIMTNDEYTSTFLKYFYNMGMDAPQQDSRVAISQVEFQSAVNFNNIYAVLLPAVNTIISGRVPNYLNTALKEEIVEEVAPYQGLTHNLVMLDPIYKACTFGSFSLDDDDWNDKQLQNKLVVVRNRLTKYSVSYIKDNVVATIKLFFSELGLGSRLNLSDLAERINIVPGVRSFYIKDVNGNKESRMTLYVWNPLHSGEDNVITQQNIINERFVYPFFYDMDNLSKLIEVEEE